MIRPPWEKSRDPEPVIEQAKAQAGNKPWDPPLPEVAPEIIHAANVKAAQDQNPRVRIDALGAQAFAKAWVTTFDPFQTMFRCGHADPDDDTSYILKKFRRYYNHPLCAAAIDGFNERLLETDILSRNRILAGLYTEAADRGPTTSSSSRVAAWSKLAKLMGMEEPAKDPNELQDRGGVMLIPFSPSIEDWETAAIGQQARLKADVRT